MTKSNQNPVSRGEGLFPDGEQFPGSLDLDSLIRRGLTYAIKHTSKSRQQVVDELSQLIGIEVTVPMLDNYTADSKRGHRFPAAWLVAFAQVTEDTYLIRRLAERVGFHLVNDEEMSLLELGRQTLLRERADEQVSELKRKLAGKKL